MSDAPELKPCPFCGGEADAGFYPADLCDPLSDPRVVALVEALEVYKEGCDWQTPPPHCDRPSYMCCKPAREALDMLKGTNIGT